MKSKKTKLPEVEFFRLGFIMPKVIVGDDGDREVLCEHGVGHGYCVHTCDGAKCCKIAKSQLKRKAK
jgi:hypothetical protein